MKFDKEKNLNKRENIRQSRAFRGKLVQNKLEDIDDATNAIAISVIGNTVLAEINKDGKKELIDCTVSGRINSPHKDSTLIAVGDNIKIIISENNPEQARVVAVENRATKISRYAVGKKNFEHVIASNFDNLFILVSTFQPNYNKRFIDRLIIAAEIGMVKPIIIVNKIDLCSKEELELFKEDLNIYNELNIPIIYISAEQDEGIDKIREIINRKTTLFFGTSGVGKSTLINNLVGEYAQVIREISERTNKGQHTTSFVKMLSLEGNTKLIDSPGVREFALWDIDKANLALHFHDFDEYHLDCKYPACTHIHEPDCAVLEALENELIDLERYESYLNIYDSLED